MSPSSELLPALAECVGSALLHSLWQGAVVAAAVALLLRLIPRSHAALRYLACLLALLVLGGAFATTLCKMRPSVPSRQVVALNTQVGEVPTAIATAVETRPVGNSSTLRREPWSSTSDTAPLTQYGGRLRKWQARLDLATPWLSAGWAFGVALLSLRQLGGWWRVRGLRRSGRSARQEWERTFVRLAKQFGLGAGVRLLESAEASGPMLVGLLRPVVLLPARLATGLSAAEIEAILAHELAHLARRDSWSNFAQVALETLFFYHPAVWWIGACARRERECAADDLALRVCTDRRTYAGALARLAEGQLAPQAALAATGGDLLARIRRIVLSTDTETRANPWSFAIPVTLALFAFGALFAARAQEGKIIVVAPGASIQQAIDAAPAGAVIRLEAGEWKERIVITKPLTLEGAGWEKTLLRPDRPDPVYEKRMAELNARAGQVSSPEEKQKIFNEADDFGEPTITVRGAQGVRIRRIKIQGAPLPDSVSDGLDSRMLVLLQNARATIAECVLTSYHCGVVALDGGDATVERTLVAAMWNFGAGTRHGGRIHVTDSEARNCRYAGLVIGRGSEALVERTRISGAAWHGIRCDDASLRLLGSTISGNDAAGIYLDGKARLEARDNLFWKNGGAIWGHSAECELEGNTFAENQASSLGFSGVASRVVRRNLFFRSVSAISAGNAGAADSASPPQISTEQNAFWQIDTPIEIWVSVSDEKGTTQTTTERRPAPAGSSLVDPQFRDAARGDFGLSADSPVKAAGIGVAEPLAPGGPWPLLAEEKAIIPTDGTRNTGSWTAPGTTKPGTKAAEVGPKPLRDVQTLVADAFQIDDRAKRDAAIERIRIAMNSSNPDEARAALSAFTQLGPIEFDKASFRPVVRSLLSSPDAKTRADAAVAFTLTGADPEDLPRIFALADDAAPEVRNQLTGAIVQLTKRDVTGKAASDAILKLINNLPPDSRSVAHALWGVKLSPEVEARVLELTREVKEASNGSVGYNFFYGTLSTQANKSEASCRRLIELLAHPDTTNIAGRSAWGLQQGVDPAQFPLVAGAMMKVVETRSDGSMRSAALRCLQTYGDVAQVPALKVLVAKPGLAPALKTALEQLLARFESKAVASVVPASTGEAGAAPASSPTAPTSSPNGTVQISADGTLKWNGEALSIEALGTKLKEGIKQSAGFFVVIRTEPHPDYKSMLKVLNVCREANVQKVAFAAEKTPGAEASAEQEKAAAEAARSAAMVAKNRQAARVRAAQDQQHYTPDQLREIETLYQVANTKGKRNAEAIASLKQLLEKYDKANRTGCATLYLGQASEGAERLEYLTRAVEKFGDCFYFNGCQVGGYGRYVLALTLWEKGEKEKARQLITELKTTLKEATDHSGRPITILADEAEKLFGAQP